MQLFWNFLASGEILMCIFQMQISCLTFWNLQQKYAHNCNSTKAWWTENLRHFLNPTDIKSALILARAKYLLRLNRTADLFMHFYIDFSSPYVENVTRAPHTLFNFPFFYHFPSQTLHNIHISHISRQCGNISLINCII